MDTNHEDSPTSASDGPAEDYSPRQTKRAGKILDAALREELGVDAERLKQLKKKLRKVEGVPERGIETLFRLVSKNHFTLKRMVDAKASILLSINAIIITVFLGTLLPSLDEDPHFLPPFIFLMTTSFVSAVFAVISSRPGRSGRHSAEHARAGQESQLFFAAFQHMGEGEFRSHMTGLMADRGALYDSLINDVYFLGQDLSRKHTFLRWSFDVFTVGLGLSILYFVLCHIMFG